MGLGFMLAGFAVSQVFEGAGGAAVSALQAVFDDPGARLPKALDEANERAWRVLELALQRRSGLLTRINTLPSRITDKERREMGERLSAFLASQALTLPDSAAAEQALAELQRARDQGLLALDRDQRLLDQAGGLARYGDQAALLAGARATVAGLGDELQRSGYPALALVIGGRPADGTDQTGQAPLLVTAFAWFFQRQVETDAELARGLQFQRLDALSAAQAGYFVELQQDFSRIGEDLGGLLAGVGRIEDGVERIDAGVQDANVTLREMDEKMDRILAQHQAGQALVSPRLTDSLIPYERRWFKQVFAEYQALPDAQRRNPVLREKLAKLQLAQGDAAGAESGFLDAAAWSTDPKAQARSVFNAYRAALEQRKWDKARRHLQRAIDLDPSLSPFPAKLYRLEAVLGAGGFGVALRCREQLTGDDGVVVIKALYGDDLDRPVAEVFREVSVLRRLRHPALIRIANHGYVDGNLGRGAFIEMEFFAGVSLADWLRQHRSMNVDDALALFEPVVAAMREVHGAGLVHRDLSPDNLLVRRDGGTWTVKLIDFGLADRLRDTSDSDGKSLLQQSITGKWDYAPPEQRGLGGEVGPWSDVYSFGRSVCAALFGTPNPAGPSIWRTLPGPLVELLESCIQDAIEQRPRDFGEVAERLAAWQGGTATKTQNPDPDLEPVTPAPASARPEVATTKKPAADKTPGAARKARPRPREADLLQAVDLHGWPADKVQARQRATAALIKERGVLDPGRTRWVDEVSFVNLLEDGGEGPEMVVVPAGSFLMGVPDTEADSESDERPQHRVHIARPFAMGRYALSFDDYDRYCDAVDADKPDDRGWGRSAGDDPGSVLLKWLRKPVQGSRAWPVINVSWDQVVAYAQWLSAQTGRACRLPSEAEWEYMARAGSTTPFWWGESITTDQANYYGDYLYAGEAKGECRDKTLPVDAFEPNPWGLYQVHGNVWEWVQDCWNDSYADAPDDGSAWEDGECGRRRRLVRGGSWLNEPLRLCSAYRLWLVRTHGNWHVGVRLAQDLSL